MDKKNNVSLIFLSNGKESPKYFDLNLSYIKYGVAFIVSILFFSIFSLYFSYKFYYNAPLYTINSPADLNKSNEKTSQNYLLNSIQEENVIKYDPIEEDNKIYKTLSSENNSDKKANKKEDLITIVNHYPDGTVEYTTQTKEEAIEDKLIEVEKKLIDMQEVLKKKGIKKNLSIGGELIPAKRLSDDYLDSIKKDIDDLSKAFEYYPIGFPSKGRISSGFGHRKDPFHKRMAFHSGIDINSAFGSEVVSTAKGIVEKAGWCDGYGKCVVIKHRDGYKTLYGHLSKVSVKRGQKIESGQLIGKVGSTGRSTGPHLHYEVIKNRKKLNPKKYLTMG